MPSTQSGAKTLVYNTRERLVSTDPNRAQSFAAQASAEVLRYLLDARVSSDGNACGSESMSAGTESPLRAHVLAGLRGRPEVGTANLFVTPGSVLLVDNPTPGSDDSLASLVSDPGVATAGQLTLTPGAGSTRIDVLECQRVIDVLEQDNRDVFNAGTGLFVPTNLTKVQAGQLAYRLRTGTPGAGFPGTVAGWLPLMVASVPAAATTWDAVTCWDVRPLVADRWDSPALAQRNYAGRPRAQVVSDVVTSPTNVVLSGDVQIDFFDGYRAGGTFSASSNYPAIDITDANNQVPGFPGFGTSGAIWYLYLVFPFGLPRWAKYTPSSSGLRQPGSLRGIPTVSLQLANMSGKPNAPTLQSPTSTGLGDAAGQPAVAALAGFASSTLASTTPLGIMVDGNKTTVMANDQVGQVPSGGIGATSSKWFLQNAITTNPGNVPGNARAAYVELEASVVMPSPAAGAEGTFQFDGIVQVGDDNANLGGTLASTLSEGIMTRFVRTGTSPSSGSLTVVIRMVCRVPLATRPQNYVFPGFFGQHAVQWSYPSSPITPSAMLMRVLGWELGP